MVLYPVVDSATSASILVITKSLPPVIVVELPPHFGHFIGAKAAIWLGIVGSTWDSPSNLQSLQKSRPLIVFILSSEPSRIEFLLAISKLNANCSGMRKVNSPTSTLTTDTLIALLLFAASTAVSTIEHAAENSCKFSHRCEDGPSLVKAFPL